MFFSVEAESGNKFPYLDIEVTHKQGTFTTTIYCKPTLNGVCSNLESFLTFCL